MIDLADLTPQTIVMKKALISLCFLNNNLEILLRKKNENDDSKGYPARIHLIAELNDSSYQQQDRFNFCSGATQHVFELVRCSLT